MDPNLFHLDLERTFEVLTAIVVLSMLIERALSIIFEHRLFIAKCSEKGVKEFISFALALIICWKWHFDAVSMIVLAEETTHIGEVVSAAVIAGGSKGSIKLFRDLLNWKSSAYAEFEEQRSGEAFPSTNKKEAAEAVQKEV